MIQIAGHGVAVGHAPKVDLRASGVGWIWSLERAFDCSGIGRYRFTTSQGSAAMPAARSGS